MQPCGDLQLHVWTKFRGCLPDMRHSTAAALNIGEVASCQQLGDACCTSLSNMSGELHNVLAMLKSDVILFCLSIMKHSYFRLGHFSAISLCFVSVWHGLVEHSS